MLVFGFATTHEVANLIQSIDKQSNMRLSGHQQKFDVTKRGCASVHNCEFATHTSSSSTDTLCASAQRWVIDGTIRRMETTSTSSADSLEDCPWLAIPHQPQRFAGELTQLRERGQLPDNKVVFNRWFITDELFKNILDEVMQVQEQTYSVIRRTRPDWISFQVTSDGTDIADTIGGGWEVVGSGMTYDIANEMQRRVSSVITARSMVDNSATTLKMRRESCGTKENCESRASDFVRECRNPTPS